MYVCMYVYVYCVCMCVCMYVCICVYICMCVYVCMYVFFVCMCIFAVLEIRIRNWSAIFLKIGYFRLLTAVPIENVQDIWLTKMHFGQPNAEIGQKMPIADCYF